tara:strand:+ start:476 stop:1345 length:870 start_codon:yes stop_codon:yes gene_type:complete
MNNRILAFSGNKQSGKSTSSNFLHGYQLRCQGIIENFHIINSGELVITTNVINENGEEEKGDAILEVTRTDLEFAEWAIYSMWPFVKHYSFASPLKEIAMALFGLTYEQCHGTDEQKNTLTNIRWGDLPLATPKKNKRKKMTAREFLQYFGTDICRTMYPDIWADRCIADISHENPLLAIIDDCRFPNEADAIQKAGGKVIRLTRSPHQDSHKSESALDDWDNFDTVINNEDLSIHETVKRLIETLDSWGWLGKEITAAEAKAKNEPEPPQPPQPALVGGLHTIKKVDE